MLSRVASPTIRFVERRQPNSSTTNRFQLWNGTDWTLNDGEQGLKRLDNVIATAGKYGIKVILAFTNNWYLHSLSSSALFSSIEKGRLWLHGTVPCRIRGCKPYP